MTDIALDFKEETASVNRLGESLRQLKIAADAANQSSLDKLRGAVAALGLGSREHLQQIAVDTRSILQKLQQEVKQTAVSSAKDITVSLAAEAVKQADIQATAVKRVTAEYKAAAASQKAIDKELHANRVASMQFEAAQRKMQIAESSAQAAIDASLHKNRVANSQFETAQLKLQEDARKAAAAEQAAIDASLHKNRVANLQFEAAQLKLQEDARKAAAAEQAAIDASLHKNRVANLQFEAAQLKLQEDARKAAAAEQAAIDASLHKNRVANSQFETAQLKLQEDARKAAAAEQAAIDASLHKNRVANSQFETAQLKLQEDARKAAAAEQAAIDASLHKNRVANLQFEAAQQLQLAKTAQQQIAAAMNSSTAPYQLYNANTLRAGSIVNAPTNPIHPKAIADTNALNVATASLTGSHKAMNDGVRGLVQSLGMYSSTLSAIIPMLAGMAIGAGLKNMLDQGRDLEYQMTFIAKLTDGAVISVDQFSKAMEGSQLTTKEGAAGLRALAQAGLSAEDALIALPDVMNLAVVGEMQLGAAALVATGIMHAFNLQLTDMPHIIDVMTKAAAISNTSVEGMATAMKTASVVSDQFGVSLEEVSSGLVVMAKRNIEGTSAGTAMKNFITNLASTTPIAAARMKQLGIEVYDTEGNLKKMAQIIPELATAFVGLNEKTKNEALKDLFNERGRRAAAALIKDVTLYGEVLGKLANESKGFAANVVSGLDHTITGQIKATANALSITFDEAFAHTSNAWSNLIAQFTDAASSSGLRLFIEDAAKAVITLVDNLGKLAIAAGAVGLAVVAWQTYSAAVIAAEAASVAAGLTVARTAVTLEAQAAAAAAAASATGVFSAVLARIAWPVAIVTALWGAFEFLSGQVDAATEAQKRYAREGQDTISKLDALIAKTNEESAALRLQTQENISLAEAVRRVRREKGLSASGEDQGQAALVKAAKELETAQTNYKKAFDTKWSAGEEAAKLKEATANYFAAIAANREMVRQAPEQLLKQQEADLSLAVKAVRTATQDNAESLREKIAEGQNYLAELKKTTPKDPKIGRLESTIADLQRLDKGLALVGETIAKNATITAGGVLSSKDLQGLKEAQGLTKGAVKELDKLFISRDKPESGLGAGGRSPHVEKVKLETSNIVEELSKRNKLVMEADKASAANRKAVLDAEFAANLIDRSSYEAEVEHLRAKADAAAIAELTRQQEVRVAAYIAADEEIQNSQNKFNSLNAKNAKAIEDNDIHIAAVRANNANKYITDYLTTVNAISTIQQKANTDVRLAEIKHQEALQKIKQEGLDWEASEIDLKAKNAKAATNASAVRRTTSPLQAAVLTAENSEFERLTANANKYDAEIKKLRESVIAYNEVQSVGTDLSSESADLDDRRSKANTKIIAQLTELVDRKNKLAAGIPIELKFKGTEATELFISTEAVRIRDGLTDAIMSAGKDGGAGLRNFLEAELLTKPFRMVIQATMEPIAQSLANSLWGGVGGGLASNGGVGGSIVNSMLGAVIGKGATMSSLGSAFGAGFSSTLAGNGLFSGASAGTAATGGAAGSGVAGAIGSAAPYIIAAAVAAGVLQRAQGSVTAAGTFAYGRNSAEGFLTGGRADFIQEGGGGTTKNSSWFDPGEETSKYMSAMGDLVTKSVKGWAEAIGLSAEAVNGYTETVQAAIGNGMSKAEERQSIDKAMAGYGDAMVQALFGQIMAFAKPGETPSGTLERLGNDVTAVNSILSGFGKPLFDASFNSAKSVQELLNSVGGLDKFKELATGLTTVNQRLEQLGLPLLDVSVAGAKAAESLLKATEDALKAKEAADKLQSETDSFSMALLTANGQSTTGVLQAIADRTLAAVRASMPDISDFAALSRITPEQYAGYSAADRAKLNAAVAAQTTLRNALDASSKAAESAAKSAKDAADTAAKAYSDALQSVQEDTQSILAQTADIGKTEFQKQIAQIQRDGAKKQAELDKLSTASDKAAKEYADLTKAATDSAKAVTTLATVFDDASAGAKALGGTASKMIADIATALAKAGVKTPEAQRAEALAMTVVQPGKGFATGGAIAGPGTGTSDSIPAMLSDGEYVIKASSAAKLGTRFLDAINAGGMPATVFRADGGSVGFDPNSKKSIIDTWVGALNWSAETMLSSALTLKNVAEDNGITVAQLKEFGYSLDNFSTDTQALIKANVSPKTWDWANGAVSATGGQPFTPTSSTGKTSTPGATSGSSVVEENTAAKLAAAYETQRVSMLGLYKATETQTDANNALAAAGYDVSGLSADGIKKYFAGLLDAAKPLADGSFSDSAKLAISQIDALGTSIGTLTKVAEERQGLQDQLDELTMNSTQLMEKQRAALADTNRALFDQIQAATKANQVAEERKGLQDQLDELTLSSVQLLEKQRAALDASNQALFDQIQAQTTAAEVAKANASLQDKIALAKNPSLQREIEKRNELASVTDASTKALIAQYYAQLDANDAIAKSAELAKINAGWQDKLAIAKDPSQQQEIEQRNELDGATDATTKALINQYYAQLDANAAAQAAQEAANALAQAYAGLKDQIAQANIELLKASGQTQAAEEATMALALRDHAGDEYYASLYRELLTIQKLTEARQQLNTLEDSAVQKQIALKRAQGDGILANAIERSAALKTALAPASAAKAELDRSNVSWTDFLATKGAGLTPQWAATGNSLAANLASGQSSASSFESLTALQNSGYGPNFLPEDLRKLLYEFGRNQRTPDQKASLQGVVDTSAGIVAAYDRNKALESELKIIELQDEAYKNNLDAQKAVTEAQRAYADVLKSTISTMQDFLKTLDGAASPLQNLSGARANFRAVADKAATGDTSAYKDLTPAAKTFLDLSKNYSRSIQDYQRDEARVRATLNAVIKVNQSELDKLPKEIAAAADPTKDAWVKLQEAILKETNTSVMLTALSVDAEASKRRLRAAEESLSDRYVEAVYMLDEAKKTPLLKTFNDAIKKLVDTSVLPEYTAFNLGDIWGTKIASVLPKTPLTNAGLNKIISSKFPGLLKSDFHVPLTPDQLTQLLNGKFPTLTSENLVGVPADMVKLVNEKLAGVLPPGFAGEKFDAKAMMQAAIDNAMGGIASAAAAAREASAAAAKAAADKARYDAELAKLAATQITQKTADTTTNVVNTVQTQGLSGGTSSTGTNFSALSATQAAAMLGADTATVTDAAKFTTMVNKYKNNPGLVSTLQAAGVDMKKWLNDANAYGAAKGFPGFTNTQTSGSSAASTTQTSGSSVTGNVTGLSPKEIVAKYSAGASVTDWFVNSSLSYISSLFGNVSADVLNDATRFTAMVKGFGDNPERIDFMKSQGVDMAYWFGNAGIWGKHKGFPGFAQGTNYVPHDMLAQIHKGEAIIPAPFNPERYGRASGNESLVEEIKALRAEVARLREEQKAGQNAIAANTRKTAQALTKFDTDGMPETRS